MLKGSFTPTPIASSLSKAQHFIAASTPVLARFSTTGGNPQLPDTDPNSNPRGFAVRFMLAETPRRVHTDILALSVPVNFARDGKDTHELFQAMAKGSLPEFLGTHPAALAWVQIPKPIPTSLAKENFYDLCAFKLIAADGTATFIRYRWEPAAGREVLDDAALKTKGPNFLYEDLPAVLNSGPIVFKLKAQIAQEDDITDDSTVQWPEDRKVVELGTLTLSSLVENDAETQKTIIFDPIPRVDGIEVSGDPLFDVRAHVYLVGGRERRAA
jgi:catalase